MWVYSDYTHTTYFCFLSGVSITHIKGRKCTSLYPFQSKEYSTEEKLFGLDLEIAVSWPLFVLANTLFVAIIFRLMEVKSVHFKKKTWSHLHYSLFSSIGESLSSRQYMGWLTIRFLDLQKAFNTVDHKILLQKPEYYGICGVCNYWLYVVVMSSTNFRVNLHSLVCLNVKELLAQSRYHIWSLSDSNRIRSHNHLVHKQALNHLAKLVKWLSCVVSTYLYGVFDCMLHAKSIVSQMHCTDKYSQYSSIIWPVWLNDWEFI